MFSNSGNISDSMALYHHSGTFGSVQKALHLAFEESSSLTVLAGFANKENTVNQLMAIVQTNSLSVYLFFLTIICVEYSLKFPLQNDMYWLSSGGE